MGWRIVAHSFSLLFRNLTDALKVSVLPLAMALVAGWLVFRLLGVTPQVLVFAAMSQNLPPRAAVAILIALVIFLLVSAWIAVAWHRFILREEYPGLMPAFRGGEVLAYVGRSIVLALVMILVMLPIFMVMSLLLSLLGLSASIAAGFVVSFAVGVIFIWIWLRIALVLPGTAVGRPLRIGESWSATADLSNEIVAAAAIIVAINLAAGILFGALPLGTVGGLLVEGAITWITVMVGTSLLTTLYGHLVEERPLP